MTRSAAALTGLLALAGSVRGADPDPAKLAPTPEQAAQAAALVAKLGDPVWQVRDDATRGLRKLGRAALPSLTDAIDRTPDPEVRDRCETLLPAAEEADLRVRLDAFLADADARYEHKLPGWAGFGKVAGTTAAARQLFADACRSRVNVELIRGAELPKAELEKLVLARRTVLYNSTVRYSSSSAAYRGLATPADVAALLFAEAGVSITGRGQTYAIQNLVNQPNTREHLRTDEPFRKVLAHWMDTRTSYIDQYQAMNVAASMNHKDLPAVKYAERLLTSEVTPVTYRMYALTTAARLGGDDAPRVLAKGLADKTKMPVGFVVAGRREVRDLEVRDTALAMSLIVAGQKPQDFGFEVRDDAVGNGVVYSHLYYTFVDDKARTAAFARWVEPAARDKPKADVKK